LVVKLEGDLFTSQKISGTRGYHAPETLKWKHYSSKSDIWQAGVCLYSMLSGFLPFHPDNDVQTIDAKYFPMTGPAWLGISDRAKDLVSRILVAEPEKRATIREILHHPWMTSEASQVELGVDYVARIKHLALRQKMRGFFLQKGFGETNKLRRGHLAEFLPFLKPSARTKLTAYVSVNSDTVSGFKAGRINSSSSLSSGYKGSEHGMNFSSSHGALTSPSKQQALQEKSMAAEFKNKLHHFQDLVIEAFREKYQRANQQQPLDKIGNYSLGGGGCSGDCNGSGYHSSQLGLEYEEFVDFLTRAGLSHLAERTVFSIFDLTNSGESLSSSLSLHSSRQGSSISRSSSSPC
jgi:serine/threonine protein kinase